MALRSTKPALYTVLALIIHAFLLDLNSNYFKGTYHKKCAVLLLWLSFAFKIITVPRHGDAVYIKKVEDL